MHRFVCASLLALCVAGCGGGGTNSASNAPPPSAPPVSTEVARQTSVNASLAALTQAETFNTIASTAKFNLDANGNVSNVTSTQAGFKTDVTIAYNPVGQTYTISTNRGGINTQRIFGASDLLGSSNGVSIYERSPTNTINAQFILARPLQYSALGAWTESDSTSGTSMLVQSSFVAFGQETAISALPKSGSATYSLLLAGYGRNGTTPYGLGGSGTANVNFAASSLTTVFDVGLYDGNGSLVSNQTLNGTATIASSFARFAGTLQGTVEGTAVSGPMSGAFFGPAAEEIGGSWKVTGGQIEAAGAFVGAK